MYIRDCTSHVPSIGSFSKNYPRRPWAQRLTDRFSSLSELRRLSWARLQDIVGLTVPPGVKKPTADDAIVSDEVTLTGFDPIARSCLYNTCSSPLRDAVESVLTSPIPVGEAFSAVGARSFGIMLFPAAVLQHSRVGWSRTLAILFTAPATRRHV